jgi:hypothetical protein
VLATYEDATSYCDFLEVKVVFGEQTTFWKRPFLFHNERIAWSVMAPTTSLRSVHTISITSNAVRDR